ncbi:hypothetical protein [Nostoc sp.]|uniref:hypothetical protein n=1 Tax=Nostoc sp. TaxID=1180 RepID=UPI002FF51758
MAIIFLRSAVSNFTTFVTILLNLHKYSGSRFSYPALSRYASMDRTHALVGNAYG